MEPINKDYMEHEDDEDNEDYMEHEDNKYFENYKDSYKYRKMWNDHMKVLNELIRMGDINLNSQIKIDLIKNHTNIMLLARNEILQYSKNIELSITNSGLDLGDILFIKLINFIGLHTPTKTDQKTKQQIIELCMIKDNEASELNLNLSLLNSNWKLNILLFDDNKNKINTKENENENENIDEYIL